MLVQLDAGGALDAELALRDRVLPVAVEAARGGRFSTSISIPQCWGQSVQNVRFTLPPNVSFMGLSLTSRPARVVRAELKF